MHRLRVRLHQGAAAEIRKHDAFAAARVRTQTCCYTWITQYGGSLQ
jgi:hypothetical protein